MRISVNFHFSFEVEIVLKFARLQPAVIKLMPLMKKRMPVHIKNEKKKRCKARQQSEETIAL